MLPRSAAAPTVLVACLAATSLFPLPAAQSAALEASPLEWCDSARRQVVEWSLTRAAGRNRPHVTAIRNLATRVDRVIESPSDGVILRCAGRATLSNGVSTRVTFGFRAIEGTWYLFLRRPRD